MGLTELEIRVANPARPEDPRTVRFLVDSGALLSIVPREVLESLGIRPHSSRKFVLADGTEMTREIGDAHFEYEGEKGGSPVIFGEAGDMVVLGSVTLESMGFIVDPVRRRLRPVPMIV